MAGPQIRVSADPSAAISALQRIRHELSKVGQEAKSLSQIDIGGMPNELASDVHRVIQQYNELLKISGSLRQHVKATGQGDVAPWNVDFNRLYVDPATANRRISQTVQRITSGTQFSIGSGGRGGGGGASAPQPAPPEPPGGGLARFAAMFVPQLRLIAGIAGIGGAAAMGRGAYDDAKDVGTGTDELLRTTRYDGMGFDALREHIRKVGDGFGVTNAEAVKLAQTFQKGSTVIDRNILLQETQGALEYAKGSGIDVGAVVQAMSRAQALGVAGSGGSMTQKEYAMLLGETIARGGMFAKGEQVMDAFGKYVEQIQSVTREAPGGVGEFSSLLGSLYGLKDAPGMKHGGAESIIAALNNGMMSPGAGEAGQFFMMRALGRYFNNDPHAMAFAMENGALANMPGTDTSPLQAVMRQLDMEMGPNSSHFARYSAMKNLFPGLSMHDAKYLEQAYRAEQSRDDGGLQAMLARAGVTPNNAAIGNLSRIYAAGSDADLRDIAKEFAKSSGIDKDKAAEIERMAGSLSGDDLRSYLSKVANDDIKYMQTPMSEMVEATRKMSDTLEEVVGQNMLRLIGAIKDDVASIADLLDSIYGALPDWMKPDSGPKDPSILGDGNIIEESLNPLRGFERAYNTVSGWFGGGSLKSHIDGVGSGGSGSSDAPSSPIPDGSGSGGSTQMNAPSSPITTGSGAEAYGDQGRVSQGTIRTSKTKQGFIDSHMAGASVAAKELGVDPKLLLGQMALETGWGRSVIPGTNNLGNIKAGRSWNGATVRAYDKAEGSNDPYRVYASTEDFWKDYAALMKRRYPGVVGAGNDSQKFAEALKAGGYATDPNYVDKLTKTINSMPATSLDSVGVPASVAASTAPDARAPEMSSSKMSGEVSIIMQHQDPFGRTIGPEQRSQMSLSRSSTQGTIRVPDLFSIAP